METILVVGINSKVLQQAIDLLLTQNYRVRAIVKNSQQLKTSIEHEKVELQELDLDKPNILTSKMLKGVNRIIYIDDLENPEQNEQLINNLQQASQSLPGNTSKMLFDFTKPTTEIQNLWTAVDDVVMGGVSQSNIRLVANRAVFSGIVSTDNNGGFASVRTRNFDFPLNLADYEGIELRVQGDGKRYKFISRCEGAWDGISYCYSFDTIYNYWITVRIPFADLIPVFRAKTVPEAGDFDPSKVYSLQLMLSKFEYDGALNQKFSSGVFGLEVEYIKAYGGQPKSPFLRVSSLDLSELKQEFS
ncbi:MAG: CIA30 family protein [Xenococcaceae cyanobacterium]